MRSVLLFIMIHPLFCIASEHDFKLHLPCGSDDVCADFESDSGPVALKKNPEMFIGKTSLLSVKFDLGEDGQQELILEMKPEVARQFTALTEKSIGSSIAIVMGSKILSQPHVAEKIENDNVKIRSGLDKVPFWTDIPWLMSMATEKINTIEKENNRSKMIYLSLGTVLFLAALSFVFASSIFAKDGRQP